MPFAATPSLPSNPNPPKQQKNLQNAGLRVRPKKDKNIVLSMRRADRRADAERSEAHPHAKTGSAMSFAINKSFGNRHRLRASHGVRGRVAGFPNGLAGKKQHHSVLFTFAILTRRNADRTRSLASLSLLFSVPLYPNHGKNLIFSKLWAQNHFHDSLFCSFRVSTSETMQDHSPQKIVRRPTNLTDQPCQTSSSITYGISPSCSWPRKAACSS